ncbi:MAG: histidine--tRNA ligase [Abditibacteriota bacterium]|nr:histidine--tRNA ligase [Abditibacteriota bacterium]
MPEYKAPRGTMDVLPTESCKWQYIEGVFRETCRRCGFSEIRTPTFEHTELFTRNLGETTDVVTKEMYSFESRSGRSLTLRPEGTAPSMRAFVEHNLQSVLPFAKMYYIARLFRYERPQAGRYREHTQLGVECVGQESPRADAEVISLAAGFLRAVGVSEYVLKLNSIGCPECRPRYREALTAYAGERLDELCPVCRGRYERNPLRMLDCKEPGCQKALAGAPALTDYLCDGCREHFAGLREALDGLGIAYTIDKNLVRGFDYYTKTAFEFVSGGLGAQNAIGGGGRYDDLISELGHAPTPAIGFGIGLERLILTLEAMGVSLPVSDEPQVYMVAAGDSAQKTCLMLAHSLREAGVRAETDFTGRSIKAQMKTAGKMNARFAVIIGDNEIASGQAAVKDMQTGVQDTQDFDRLAGYIQARSQH